MVMASEAGGMDIEEVAEQAPEKIVRIPIDPVLGPAAVSGPKDCLHSERRCRPGRARLGDDV